MRYRYRVYRKKAKLVGSATGDLWLLNRLDEWIHDCYEESRIYHGTIYSVSDSFHPLSTGLTGVFQDEESKKWIYVINGIARVNSSDQQNVGWNDSLEELLEKQSFK